MNNRKIYLASSWRNPHQERVLALLRANGHEVYDFKNPTGGTGFRWCDADPLYDEKNIAFFMADIQRNPVARRGFYADKDALNWADTCVLLLPCGKSAHLEAGYAAGQGKDVLIYLDQDSFEPELMYLFGNGFVRDDASLCVALRQPVERMNLTTYGY